MSPRAEIIPSEDQIRMFSEGVVVPALNKMAKDSARRVVVSGAIMTGTEPAVELPVFVVGKADIPAMNGTLRFRFREAFGGRVLMHCECIFEKDQAIASCSGFSLNGELKDGITKCTGWVIRYSVLGLDGVVTRCTIGYYLSVPPGLMTVFGIHLL